MIFGITIVGRYFRAPVSAAVAHCHRIQVISALFLGNYERLLHAIATPTVIAIDFNRSTKMNFQF